ncbi:MAG: radical SAM protein [Nannocystis sp.]|nr:radical SAM protein [Nannocystis sp.]
MTTTERPPSQLRVAYQAPLTAAEGPHRRYALWLAGCSLRCPGCCNPELFDPASGAPHRVDALADVILAAKARHDLEGVTVLGGEPLDQQGPLTHLLTLLSGQGLGVILFSGYTHAEARRRPGFDRLAAVVDTLIDGRFDAARREPEAGGRRWIGSTNQQKIHLTPRYADPALWTGEDHLELTLDPDRDALTLHGHPQLARRLLHRLR